MVAYQSFNPNPRAAKVGDCAVRAVAKALGIGWYHAYVMLASERLNQCDMPSANNVWGAVLRRDGFRRAAIPEECPDCWRCWTNTCNASRRYTQKHTLQSCGS